MHSHNGQLNGTQSGLWFDDYKHLAIYAVILCEYVCLIQGHMIQRHMLYTCLVC